MRLRRSACCAARGKTSANNASAATVVAATWVTTLVTTGPAAETATGAAPQVRGLRNMCGLSFQYLLNDDRGALRGIPATRKFFPDFGQSGLHAAARHRVRQQPARLLRDPLASHLALH